MPPEYIPCNYSCTSKRPWASGHAVSCCSTPTGIFTWSVHYFLVQSHSEQKKCELRVNEMFLINLQSDGPRGQAPASADLNGILSSSRSLIVGRDGNSDLQLDSEDMPAMVSRVHAEFAVREGKLSIQDRGSMNGT